MPRRKLAPDRTLLLCQRAARFVEAIGGSGIEIPDVLAGFQAAVEMAVVRQCLADCLGHHIVRQGPEGTWIHGPVFERTVRDTCDAHREDAADPLEQWGIAWPDFVGIAPTLVDALRALE